MATQVRTAAVTIERIMRDPAFELGEVGQRSNHSFRLEPAFRESGEFTHVVRMPLGCLQPIVSEVTVADGRFVPKD
jgi:hypothetical protein